MSYRRRRGLRGQGSGGESRSDGGGAGPEDAGGAPGRGGSPGGPGARFRRRSGPGAAGASGGATEVGSIVRRWAVAAGVLGACFLVGYLLAAEWLFPPAEGRETSGLVEIPELVGLSAEEARERVEALGLTFTIQAGIAHPRAPEGAVLAQTPLPGQMARPGAPVYTTLSRGPERHVLPDVSGLSKRQATIVLEGLGYRVRSETRQARTERGRAVGTRPEAGTELPVPSEVLLFVSAGPPVVSVPDLTGLHVDDVAARLAEARLELGEIRYDPAAYEAPQRVIGQYPPAGYKLREGGTVEIRVAGRRTGGDAPRSSEPERGRGAADVELLR